MWGENKTIWQYCGKSWTGKNNKQLENILIENDKMKNTINNLIKNTQKQTESNWWKKWRNTRNDPTPTKHGTRQNNDTHNNTNKKCL